MIWLPPLGRVPGRRATRTRRIRPGLEALEDRRTPSVTVTTPVDLTSTVTGQLSLRQAVALVDAGKVPDNTIVVPAGAYVETQGALSATHSLSLQGAGAGSTIIDGSGADRVLFVHPGAAVTVQLSGLTVRNGKTPGFGGGIDVEDVAGQSSALTLSGCAVSGNTAGGGGGISNSNGDVTLTGCQVLGNAATGGAGGGVLLSNGGTGNLTVTDSTISGNTAAQAGGIALLHNGSGGSLTILRSTISNNQAQGGPGGGVEYDGPGAVHVANSVFSGNTAAGNATTERGGGGLDATAATSITIADSLFSGNSVANGNGGGLEVFDLSNVALTVSGSTFTGNQSPLFFGGGLNITTVVGNTVTPTVVNDTFAGNTAAVGGGVEVMGSGAVNLISDTITGNAATVRCGGVEVLGGIGGLFLDNIVAGNSANNPPGEADLSPQGFFVTSGGGNFIGDNTTPGNTTATTFPAGTPNGNGDFVGTAANPLNPLLGPLQNNGGVLAGAPGSQQVVPTEALLAGSPAIGKGVVTGAPATDGRGFPRAPGRLDSGAFAFQALASVTTLAGSANPAPLGRPVTFTATVTGLLPGTNTAPTGTVTFTLDGVAQPPVALTNGMATFTPATPLAVGPHTLTAAYSGDSTFVGSTQTLTETVSLVTTTTRLVSSANPALPGQPVTFTAAVSSQGPGAGTPTGSVTFAVDGMQQPPVPLLNGVAQFTATGLTTGLHTVTAAYGGDGTFAASTQTATETVLGLTDVSGLVRVTPVPARGGKHYKANPLVQTLLVTNVSGADIPGPLYLLLDGLSGKVTLRNPTGLSQTHVKTGDPFVQFRMGPLSAGQSAQVTLLFTVRKRVNQVLFTPFVLAGPGAA